MLDFDLAGRVLKGWGGLIACGLFLVVVAPSWAELPRVPGDRMTTAQIEKGAPAVHPATLYVLAQRLFAEGRKDEAVFWYYVGQLRFRFYLAVNPHLESSGDPALFSVLSDVVGNPIDRFGFQDPRKLVQTLERVEQWDEETPNGFTSKENNHAVWLEVREGFKNFIAEVGRTAAATSGGNQSGVATPTPPNEGAP
jgi:hypothetical protein